MKLLAFLLAFFALGVGEPDPDADKEEEKQEDAPDPADDLDLDLPDAAPDKDKPDGKDARPSADEFNAAQAAVKAEKERADRYERELGDLRRQRGPAEDEVTRRENARLADEKTSDLEKWQIQANRELRAGRNAAQFALAQAHDVSDKTAFAAVAIKKPALFKRYEARVEEELAKVRANGGNAQREAIFKYLIGQDALDDKFARKKPAADKGEEKTTVARGKLPGARSDVTGKSGAMTAKQKLERKLQDVQI
jgi:hypothetical protein